MNGYWVPYVIGPRQEIRVALDWTEFDHDNHSTIALNMITRHGRATPLVWKSVRKSSLKGQKNRYEDELLLRFKEVLPQGVRVTVLADRMKIDAKAKNSDKLRDRLNGYINALAQAWPSRYSHVGALADQDVLVVCSYARFCL
jgi:hypothetical protein